MKQSVLFFSMLLGLILFSVSCKTEKTFEVKGEFASATDETVYLEHRALGGIEMIDSVKLKGDGTFKFKDKSPENPEFYQLRVGNQLAVFAVDSNETLVVKGDVKKLPQTFRVENSPANDQIRQIDISTGRIKAEIKDLEQKHKKNEIGDMQYLTEIDSILSHYKDETTKLILGNPGGAVAYYAVFQKINDYLIFDPYDKRDYAMFGAVATSWDKYHHGTARAQHLYDFTMKALKTRRQQEQQVALLENAPVITDSALPEIELREVNGEKKLLSDLKGKVVVLDFTVYNSEFSPKHNFDLNTIYSQLQPKGLEIYQISFDSNEHFWKNAANNLPWITVRDPQNVYSRLLSTYNVREIPTAFVIDRNGDITARVENYATLASEINKVL